MFPELNKITVKKLPFEYFFGESEIESNILSLWLDWFESSAPWKLTETDFYEQYEFSLRHTKLPDQVKYLVDSDMLEKLCNSVEKVFKIELESKVDIVAHKLLSGQTIRVHNDFLEESGAETHRVLLQLNRSWNKEKGGFLMFFSDPQAEHLSDLVEPVCGSIQGFKISPDSYHAVSTVHGGERYTIVYSFFLK
ncbi:MAG: 2OG-Fe(II) oxygenase [Methylomarinum sp.]|nr:2OG-Fe(II) oxygenase [Methylomarinum sp.]